MDKMARKSCDPLALTSWLIPIPPALLQPFKSWEANVFEVLTLLVFLPFQNVFAQLDFEASNDNARPNARVS